MFSVLGEILCIHAIIGQLRIAVQLIVFLNDLLRGAAHFAIRTRAIKHPVNDVSARRSVVAALIPRP
jgi:hypothetical protein